MYIVQCSVHVAYTHTMYYVCVFVTYKCGCLSFLNHNSKLIYFIQYVCFHLKTDVFVIYFIYRITSNQFVCDSWSAFQTSYQNSSGGGGGVSTVDSQNNPRLNEVRSQVSDVQNIMRDNIERVMERGERLDDLVDRAEDMYSQVRERFDHLIIKSYANPTLCYARNVSRLEIGSCYACTVQQTMNERWFVKDVIQKTLLNPKSKRLQ